MDNKQPIEGDLTEEFRQLGRNLTAALNAAWESPERKRLQEEISSCLSELGSTLRSEAHHIKESPTGQKIKTETEDFRQRVRSGEVESRLRQDLISALQRANDLLRQAVEKMSEGRQPSEPSSPESGEDLQ